MAKQRPTRRQLEVLRAYIRAGSVAAAAHELGISETTVRQHLSGLYRRTGCVNAAQAAYWLGAGHLTFALDGQEFASSQPESGA
jgi:DNA-binding NarL/FixJ family response regulator